MNCKSWREIFEREKWILAVNVCITIQPDTNVITLFYSFLLGQLQLLDGPVQPGLSRAFNTAGPARPMADWRKGDSLSLFLIFTYWSQATHYWILKRHSSIGKGIFHLQKHRQNVLIWVTWQPSFYFYFLINVMRFSSSIFTPRFMKPYVIVCSLVLESLSYFFLRSGLPCRIPINTLLQKLNHNLVALT